MKILILLTLNRSFAALRTELELIQKHIKHKDEVFIYTCTNKLNWCLYNLDNKKSLCIECKTNFNCAKKQLQIPSQNIIFFEKNNVWKNIKPKLFKNVEDLKQFNPLNSKIGESIASILVSQFRDHNFNTKLHGKYINRIIKTSITFYYDFVKKLMKINPDLVYIFNGRIPISKQATMACQNLKINFIQYEASKDSFFLAANKHFHSVDYLKETINKKWASENQQKNTITKQWFLLNKTNSYPKQMPHKMSSNIKKKVTTLLPKGFNLTKRNIAVFNSSNDEYAVFPGWDNPIYKSDNNGLFKIFNEFKNNTDFIFYVRIHPNLKNLRNSQILELEKLESYGYKNVHFIKPKEKINSYELLSCCEKVITFGSTIGAEAVFWGKPSILLGRSGYEDLGCCYIPKNHIDVVNHIKSFLTPKPPKTVFPLGYYYATPNHKYRYIKSYDSFLKYSFQDKVLLKISKFLNKINL